MEGKGRISPFLPSSSLFPSSGFHFLACMFGSRYAGKLSKPDEQKDDRWVGLCFLPLLWPSPAFFPFIVVDGADKAV